MQAQASQQDQALNAIHNQTLSNNSHADLTGRTQLNFLSSERAGGTFRKDSRAAAKHPKWMSTPKGVAASQKANDHKIKNRMKEVNELKD
jgi:hypothetical protein